MKFMINSGEIDSLKSVGDYLTDESTSPEQFYNDLKNEVQDWVDYYKKYYDKSSKVLSYIQRESLISEATDKDWEDFGTTKTKKHLILQESGEKWTKLNH